MDDTALFARLLLAPLVGFAINGLRFRARGAVFSGLIGTAAAAASCGAAVILISRLFGTQAPKEISAEFFQWISVGSLQVSARFVLDPVSAIMVMVITGVGTLIHLFSIGYMAQDNRPAKYFAYLNLFLFSMLLLVLGDGLLTMFIGWEAVGLCSYLLIGFWFTDREKATAGMKAFITNRIGDAGFLLGLFIVFTTFGTLQFTEIIGRVPDVPEAGWTGPITLACLFLFLGAVGKSAQIPLYVWLPDAMAGPTPVSALIHAATMVTAGVYMVVRLSPLYLAAPNALHVVAVVGALTAVFAATIGLLQNDIKKILAYSTVSQLGYMFLACGVGAFGAALFHLMTHAFFKALMFLGAGSVIHAMNGEQDITKMGGLQKQLPLTHLTFVAGWLAISGIPPFAGFFSKDEILSWSFSSPLGHKGLWVAGIVGSICTAFYMTRLMALTFWGKSRVSTSVHPHESPLVMTLPLIVLAILSLVGGFVGIPHVIGSILPGHPGHGLASWLDGSVAAVAPGRGGGGGPLIEIALMGASVSLAALSGLLAFNFYVVAPDRPAKLGRRFAGIHRVVFHKYYVDEFYMRCLVNPTIQTSRALWSFVDLNFFDRVPTIASDLVRGVGAMARTLQSGNIQTYAMYVTLAIAAVLWVVFRFS